MNTNNVGNHTLAISIITGLANEKRRAEGLKELEENERKMVEHFRKLREEIRRKNREAK